MLCMLKIDLKSINLKSIKLNRFLFAGFPVQIVLKALTFLLIPEVPSDNGRHAFTIIYASSYNIFTSLFHRSQKEKSPSH